MYEKIGTGEKKMMKEAQKLREEFRDYLEDLELFSDPKFWEAISEARSGGKLYSSVVELKKELKYHDTENDIDKWI